MTDKLLGPDEKLSVADMLTVPPSVEAPAAANSVGKLLREARESRGLSVEAVADILRFSEKQIHHIESDNYGALPGATLVRGFIRGYAKFLRLDPQQLLDQLDSQVPVETSDIRPPSNIGLAGQDAGKESVSPRAVLIAAAVMLLAVIGGFLFTQMDEASIPVAQEPAPVMPPPATVGDTLAAPMVTAQDTPSVASPSDTVGSSAASSPAAGASTTALVIEFDDLSWIEVRDASQNVIFVGEFPKGTRQVVEGKAPLALWVGRASVVRATYKGAAVDLKSGSREDIARVTLD